MANADLVRCPARAGRGCKHLLRSLAVRGRRRSSAQRSRMVLDELVHAQPDVLEQAPVGW